MRRSILFVGLSLVLLPACALKNQRVRYDLKDVAESSALTLKDRTLLVREFEDGRKEFSDNNLLFEKDHDARIEGNLTCINSDRQYAKPVPVQLQQTVADHLAKRSAFKTVTTDSNQPADFVLVGKLDRLYGLQGYSMKSAIGSQFGLIGALLTMGAKTDGTIKIQLSNLKLLDSKGNLVKDLGTVEHSYEGSLPADGYCWNIYLNVNQQLKTTVDKLANAVEEASAQYASIPQE
jgi:hypothetical protein